MTAPEDPTREQPVVEQPSVSTAPPATPAQRHRWWSVIPRHLGRARTSTVVISLLFVGLFVLYLNVRPDPEATAGNTSGGTDVTEPAPATGSTTTPAPSEPTTVPAPTTAEETGETTTTVPEESTLPPEPTETVPPPTTGPTTSQPPVPTTSEPTG